MMLKQVTPFVPCSALDRQIAFYRDILGFALTYHAHNYAFMRRDAVALRLVEVDAGTDLGHPERQTSFYIDVEGLDAVYDDMADRLATLPAGRVRAPFEQDYGQREFHVIDEDCTLIFFGERSRAQG